MSGLNMGTLKKLLPKRYKHRGLIAQELFNVQSNYKSLTPVMDKYVFNDGTKQQLMSLRGTIPVCFIGKQFNIPVCLWLLDSYPQSPPICFVKPTKEMMVATGRYTDPSGQLSLPYLQEWSYPQTDLYGLIQVFTVVFAEEPPVYCRSPIDTIPTIIQEDWQSPLSNPEAWMRTEVISPSDKETYFALKSVEGLQIPVENESNC